MSKAIEFCLARGWFDGEHKLTPAGEVALERIMDSLRIYCPRCERYQYFWDENDYICTDCRYGF